MKFNLSDFLQLDTKELLAVNGGFNCNGSSNTTVYPNTYYPSGSSYSNGGGGGSGADKKNSNQPVKTVQRSTGTWEFYGDGSGVWTDNDGEKHAFGPVNHINDSIKNEASNNISASSSGGSCSTPTSNNHNGQGPSTTSSNPGGNQHKDTKTYSGGGTCTKTGGQSPVNPNPTNPDDITSGGGTCSSKNDTDKVSGMFGQITDGSYEDELTMQFYKNNEDEYSDSNMYGTHYDKKTEQIVDNKFSEVGCKEAAATKIIAEFEKSTYIDMTAVQYFCDSNQDGDLSAAEIAEGINKMLDSAFDDKYDVKCRDINKNIDLDTLNDISNKKDGEETYVLGFAPDCWGGHWVVLEGYTQNPDGVISFDYDGTSDNDKGRAYVLGKDNQDKNTNTWGITRIQTFTIYQK